VLGRGFLRSADAPETPLVFEVSAMVKSKYAKRYPKEFRHQMVKLHRAGRTLSDLARQFGPTPWAISRCVKSDAAP
jgi:hypothetical protein